jgi:hypothetical protein
MATEKHSFPLFGRVTTFLGMEKPYEEVIMKGEEHQPSVTELKRLIDLCKSRSQRYRFISVFTVSTAACMTPVTAMMVEQEQRYITASIGIFLIWVTHIMAWPKYAEKHASVAQQLQDMHDCIILHKELTQHQKLVYNRIVGFIGSGTLYSDHAYFVSSNFRSMKEDSFILPKPKRNRNVEEVKINFKPEPVETKPKDSIFRFDKPVLKRNPEPKNHPVVVTSD